MPRTTRRQTMRERDMEWKKVVAVRLAVMEMRSERMEKDLRKIADGVLAILKGMSKGDSDEEGSEEEKSEEEKEEETLKDTAEVADEVMGGVTEAGTEADGEAEEAEDVEMVE